MIDLGKVLEVVGVSISILGTIFLAHKKIVGFKVFIVGNCFTGAFAIYYSHWFVLAQQIVYALIDLYSIWKWKKDSLTF